MQLLIYSLSFMQYVLPKKKFITGEYQLCIGTYYLYLSYGADLDSFLGVLDISSPITSIPYKLFKQNKYPSTRNINDNINMTYSITNKTIIGQEKEDYFLFISNWTTIVIPELSFIVIDPSSTILNPKSKKFALGFDLINKNHSIIYQLKANDLIDDLSFTFDRDRTGLTNGIIYFGPLPGNITDNLYKTSCKVNSKEKQWGCRLSYVFIGNITYIYENIYFDTNYPAFFNTNFKCIKAPVLFYELLIETLFTQYLKTNQCNQKKYDNKEVYCHCSIMDQLTDLTFVFNDASFVLHSRSLFTKYEDMCLFMIEENYEDYAWYFGSHFINQYITTFSYDNNDITFYSSEAFPNINLDILFPEKRIKKWSIIVILICLLILLIKGGSMILNRRRKRMHRQIRDQVDLYMKIL